MYLAILGKREDLPDYMGLDRKDIFDFIMVKDFMPEAELAFSEYMRNSNISDIDGEYLDSISTAKSILSILKTNRRFKDEEAHIFEITYDSQLPSLDGSELLGFDVVISNEGDESEIVYFLLNPDSNPRDDGTIRTQFREELNDYRLFSVLDTAHSFLNLVSDRTEDSFEWSVVGIWRVKC